MIPDEFWAEVDEIDGWLTRREADLLYRLCQGEWCEIGTYRGRSAKVLAATGHPGVCIDMFSEHKASLEAARKATNGTVKLVKGKFQDHADEVGPIQFLHLDADHSYEGTREAWMLYAPKVEDGGFVVVHDAFPDDSIASYNPYPEVTRFVGELMVEQREWHLFTTAGRSAAFRKCV